jgi:hypothetical protein
MPSLAVTLGNLSAIAGIVGALVAIVAVAFVVIQVRAATAVARAQATIQFQRAFKESGPARARLQATFPIHVDLLAELGRPEDTARFRTWRDLSELTEEDRADARIVINAMNDVAQYVSDGLSLRSALQQYHTIFVRAGALLWPYVRAVNAPPDPEGAPQARYGYRIIDLYNAGLAYQRNSPKHAGRELALERPSRDKRQKERLLLVDVAGAGLQPRAGVGQPEPTGSLTTRRRLRRAIRAAERNLRP